RADIDVWRENFKGVSCVHEPTGFTISGAIDDVWVNPKGELHVVDYKSTSKDEAPTLDADWQDGYKRQMEVYQWLLRQNGFKVSDTGYFVYANGKKDVKAFDGKLEFDISTIPYTGSDAWIPAMLLQVKECLQKDTIPDASPECDYCLYRNTIAATLQEMRGERDREVSDKKEKSGKPRTLF
ncbi:MAG: PD-(D/E)XK nuclease family protein, partial [Patescibacteria group bacterium]